MRAKNRLSLMGRMVIALAVGFAVGIGFLGLKMRIGAESPIWREVYRILFANIEAASDADGIGIFYIVGQLFMHALQLGIMPLVFISLTLAMEGIEDRARLGRIAGKAILSFLIFYVICVVLASLIAYVVKSAGFFNISLPMNDLGDLQKVDEYNPLAIFMGIVPSNLFSVFSDNGAVLSVIFVAVVTGLCMHRMPDQTKPFRDLLRSIDRIVLTYLDFLIDRVSPWAICFMISRAFATYGVEYLLPAGAFVITVVLSGPVLLLSVYPIAIFMTTHLNPLPFIRKTVKTALLAAATQSSAAVLPENMASCVKELGCSSEYSSFILPCGMAIHMNGTTVMQIVAVTFIATAAGIDIQPYQIALAAGLSIIMAIATPPVPMAGVTLVFVLMNALGFTTDLCYMAYSLVLAINFPASMAVMPMNVVGDAAVDIIVCSKDGELDEETYNSRSR
ncbi:sodium:dicarboxylate symporter [Coriobacterium glomerans PW2]|uniref:Sodium:dicarboxylate symporter n=1 Tax=Coriobacterium glomerans (strain ATCC 49209 / DSM 20642 / JCM 10262 / PW2) TaxID=700015 RepID=F2N8Y8_CORGP|nr:dicarboxylate/amino acid:cation symporter [Coriobacterium glomerans]AEB07588.1 sodium:dicarboxylate symporter [Coriobacterium glomerans PW2]